MDNNAMEFRKALIELQPLNNELQSQFEQEIDKMIKQELSSTQRAGAVVEFCLIFLFGVFSISSAAFGVPIELPFVGRILWGLGGAVSLIIAAIMFRTVLSRKKDLRKDSIFFTLVASNSMTFVGFAILFAGIYSRDLQQIAIMAPLAMLVVIMGILINIHNRVQQGELNTREKLLEIEYRLASLDEKMTGK